MFRRPVAAALLLPLAVLGVLGCAAAEPDSAFVRSANRICADTKDGFDEIDTTEIDSLDQKRTAIEALRDGLRPAVAEMEALKPADGKQQQFRDQFVRAAKRRILPALDAFVVAAASHDKETLAEASKQLIELEDSGDRADQLAREIGADECGRE